LGPFADPTTDVRNRLEQLGAKGGPLDPLDPDIPPADALAQSATNKDNNLNAGMTVGFTFLGQFIDHDITFDPTSSLERQQDPESVVNFRTPAFELDSIYGSGLGASPHLLDQPTRSDEVPDRKTGRWRERER
jgi:hypothetical protein